MKLVLAKIQKFKSIDDSTDVKIDERITALVGQNESGKTAFLQALHKARSSETGIGYDVTEDYPRKDLLDYEPEHTSNPTTVVTLTYKLDHSEIQEINNDLDFELLEDLSFSLNYQYNNQRTVSIDIPEKPYLDFLVSNLEVSSEVRSKLIKESTVKQLIKELGRCDLNEVGQRELEKLTSQFSIAPNWSNLLAQYIFSTHITDRVPKFLYFDDYRIIPGKAHLPSIKQRQQSQTLTDEDRAILRLLDVTRIELDTILEPGGYEREKARLEATSNKITNKVFRFWQQNKDLRVEFDVAEDPNDNPPFDSGKNFYIRVYNPRHGVTVPFDQRSKGFIWFFSFIAWFDSLQREVGSDKKLVLLLDEPGLSLHALAQADLLNYIEHLSEEHQILYSTHSPFMVEGKSLHRVRTVEDREDKGTVVSSDVSGSTPNTLFPLQAALGYSIAQNLFISKQNLLVEGIADLAYLQTFSVILDAQNRTSISQKITITPVGGLTNISAFVSLFRANELDIVVLHDFEGTDDQKLTHLIREKLLQPGKVLNYAKFREPGGTSIPTDVEDLLSPGLYLRYFNKTFERELNPNKIHAKDLCEKKRIVQRINSYLDSNNIKLRPSGGFNHYRVANAFASNPPKNVDKKVLDRFEQLFKTINDIFSN
jgi:predicted ATP-dependent endonuclease of OLD family